MPRKKSNFEKKVEGYTVKVSNRKNKKYDVYDGDKYMLSIGDKRYEQYHDKIGYYTNLDHKDKHRLENFWKRHHYSNDPKSKGHWLKYLW